MIDDFPEDVWLEHLANGEAFAAESLVLAVGGMFPQGQLFNPVGSNKRIRIRCIEPMAFLGSTINTNIRRHDVALTNLDAPAFGAPQNLLGGGPAELAQFRFDNPAALVGSPFWLILATGNQRRDYPALNLEWGHDLLPGQGIMMSGVFGGFLIMGWKWVEVPL